MRARGAGEILLTSIDRDGARTGYDLELTRAVVAAVDVPVVASGGAGSAGDVLEVLDARRADAALLAGILHDGVTTVRAIKAAARASGLPVRASHERCARVAGARSPAAVERVARIAGDIALGYYKTSLVIETKADGSPVTIADREAEQAARAWIEHRFPDDGILGEELGETRPDARRRWVSRSDRRHEDLRSRCPVCGARSSRCARATRCSRARRTFRLLERCSPRPRRRLLVEWRAMPGVLASQLCARLPC